MKATQADQAFIAEPLVADALPLFTSTTSCLGSPGLGIALKRLARVIKNTLHRCTGRWAREIWIETGGPSSA